MLNLPEGTYDLEFAVAIPQSLSSFSFCTPTLKIMCILNGVWT